MCTKNNRAAGGNFVQVFDENSALCAQAIDHKFIVHHLVTHVDGRTKFLQGLLNNNDGSVHAGTEASRIGQYDIGGYLHAGYTVCHTHFYLLN